MESARGFLLVALGFLSFLLFINWQEDYAPKPAQSQIEPISDTTSSLEQDFLNEVAPDSINSGTASLASEIPTETAPTAQASMSKAVVIQNDLLKLAINPQGGDIVDAELLDFLVTLDNPDVKVRLLANNNQRTFIAQSVLLGTGTPDAANNRAVYSIVSNDVDQNGNAKLVLQTTTENGVVFTKSFELKAGTYQLKVSYQVNNTTSEQLSFKVLNQLKRDRFVESGSGFGIQAYTGAAYSSSESRYEKYEFDDIDETPLSVKTKAGWIAFLQHYFLVAWVPDQSSTNDISTIAQDNGNVIIRLRQEWKTIPPQAQQIFESTLYIGPKDQEALEKLAEGLDLTVDYSIFWWIGQPLFWLLTFFQGIVINWGFAIILVTITVKAVLYPLASAQYRSFAKMRMLQPKLMQLKERYGEDRAKMSQAMMELYKKEKVNPMGGCLPLIVQMPVFFALYWVLLESYEIRHAPFMLWINDLSAADPYFILPLLMGASMWLMQKMQPTAATMDPMQQKIMQFMPVMMTVFFFFFPAGLVLYWLVNNLLSIAQQLYITKKTEQEHAQKKA